MGASGAPGLPLTLTPTLNQASPHRSGLWQRRTLEQKGLG
jgi:hypothetical protein